MLYNEMRPHKFDSMVGQKHIVESLRNQAKTNNWFQVYIFAGQYGGGKTTMARIVSLAANCSNKDENGNPCLKCESCNHIMTNTTTDIIEIDAASNTGVDNIRELRDNAAYMPVNLAKKIYIIDEAHMLSKGAFNALLKLLEEPPKHTIFILCTTELKAIPATVRSRAATYIFEQITFSEIMNKLKETANAYGINITDDALALIAKNSHGSMRNAYALLEQIRSEKVDAEDVRHILGLSDPTHLFQLLKNIILANTTECILGVETAAAMGKDMSLMINDLIEIVTDAVVAISISVDKLHNTEYYKSLISEIIEMTTVDQLTQIADGLMDIRIDLRKCPEKTTVIVGLIRITTRTISKSFMKRLEELELVINNMNSIKEEDREEATNSQTEDSIKAEIYNETGRVTEQKVDQINNNSSSDMEDEDKSSDINDDCTKDSFVQDEFDIFDIFDIAESGSTEEENFHAATKEVESSVQEKLEARLQRLSEIDAIIRTALTGCIKLIENDTLILKTPLRPVKTIIKKYLEACEIKDIVVEFDASIIL